MSTLSTAKLDLSQPQKFQMASIVTKNSRLGITSNKRLLAIRKGYLYYYSNVPKKFKGDSSILETIHELPKCSIQIVNIKQIKGFQSNSSYFSIEFEAKNMLERQDIRKTMTLEQYNFSPKNTKENIVWQFTCDNQFIKQRWVAALEGLQTHYNREKKDIEKFFNQHKNGDHSSDVNSSSGGRNSQIPWRQSQSFNRKSKNGEINYLQLVSNKSNDEGSNKSNTSMSPDNKFPKNNHLQVTDQNNNTSRARNISQNRQQQKKQDFMKQYSPKQTLKGQFSNSKPGYSNSSSQESLQIPKNTKNLQNSPINNLQLSDIKAVSPTKDSNIKQSNYENNMLFSKTQKMKVSEQTIQEQESETNTNQSPTQSPMKVLVLDSSDSDMDDKQADEFQLQIIATQENLKQNKESIKTQNDEKAVFNQVPLDKKQLNTSAVKIDSQKHISSSQQYPKSSQTSKVQLSIQAVDKLTFYQLHALIFSKHLSFIQRIQVQKHFQNKINQFVQRSTANLVSYVDSLSQGNDHNFEIIYKTNNFTVMTHQATDTLFKLAFVTSQTLQINGNEKVYFDQEAIKNLKREFKLYNDLEKYLILHNLKNDTSFRLRVPLSALIEYKGIVSLAIDQSYLNDQYNQVQTSAINQQIKQTYAKQIDILNNLGYQPKDFTFTASISSKKQELVVCLLPQIVSNRMCKQQFKKSYLKRLLKINRPEKHHNIELNPPFNEDLIMKAHQSNASTSIQSFQQYINTLTKIPQFKGVCPKEQIIQIFKICVFCKQIRKIYRSAQGEIQETHFLNLILKGDTQMMRILNQSGCDQIPRLKGVLFAFIRHYLGISCTVNQKILKQFTQVRSQTSSAVSKPKKGDIILSTQISPKFQTYDLSKLQLHESYDSLKKFILQQKTTLAAQALKMLQNLNLQQFSTESKQKKLQMRYMQASLAYLQHDFLKSIQLCKNYEKQSDNHNPKLFFVYLLMLKSYSNFSDEQFKTTFQKLVRLIEFNYGPNNSVLISIYCISSYYFSQMAQKRKQQKHSIQLDLLSFKLLQQAENLSLRHFGQDSSQHIDILIDLARLYQHKNQPKSQGYSDRARTIIISSQNKQKLIDYLMYDLKVNLNGRNYNKCEIMIDKVEELVYVNKIKIQNSKLVSLMKAKFEVGMRNDKLHLSQRAVQVLWRSQKGQAKMESVRMAAKLCKKLKIIPDSLQQLDDRYNHSLTKSIQQSSFQSSFSHYEPHSRIIVQHLLPILQKDNFQALFDGGQSLISRIRQLIQDQDDQEIEERHVKRWLVQIS